jgi:hypothetical protein
VTSKEMWKELRTLNYCARPRFDTRHGACPLCGLGATLVREWCSVWWAGCETCRTRWVVGERVFTSAADQGIDDRVAALVAELPGFARFVDIAEYAWLLEIAEYAQLLGPLSVSLLERVSTTMKPDHDPQADAAARTPGGPITTEELRSRQIAQFELLTFAELLGWPSLVWLDPEGRQYQIPSGRIAWLGYPLGAPWKRRQIYTVLIELEQRMIGHTSAVQEKGEAL